MPRRKKALSKGKVEEQHEETPVLCGGGKEEESTVDELLQWRKSHINTSRQLRKKSDITDDDDEGPMFDIHFRPITDKKNKKSQYSMKFMVVLFDYKNPPKCTKDVTCESYKCTRPITSLAMVVGDIAGNRERIKNKEAPTRWMSAITYWVPSRMYSATGTRLIPGYQGVDIYRIYDDPLAYSSHRMDLCSAHSHNGFVQAEFPAFRKDNLRRVMKSPLLI